MVGVRVADGFSVLIYLTLVIIMYLLLASFAHAGNHYPVVVDHHHCIVSGFGLSQSMTCP